MLTQKLQGSQIAQVKLLTVQAVLNGPGSAQKLSIAGLLTNEILFSM
jgi:hypothetical protein